MLRNILSPSLKKALLKTLHTSSFNGVREIVCTKIGNETTIEGKIVKSPREPYLIKPDSKIIQNACVLCKLNLDIKHTDVLILQQFITTEGEILPREVIGICEKQYRRITQLVAMAQESGLLGNFLTWEGYTDISQRTGFKKWNTYYDERTINVSEKKKFVYKSPRKKLQFVK